MKRERIVVLRAVTIGVFAALGVGIASQVLRTAPLDTSVDHGVRAGLVATLIFLVVDYIRQNLL